MDTTKALAALYGHGAPTELVWRIQGAPDRRAALATLHTELAGIHADLEAAGK